MKERALSLTTAMLLCFTASCFAATVTWNNSAGGEWSEASNWTPNQVPGSADTAVIDLPGSYIVMLHGNVSISELVLGVAPRAEVDIYDRAPPAPLGLDQPLVRRFLEH